MKIVSTCIYYDDSNVSMQENHRTWTILMINACEYWDVPPYCIDKKEGNS